MPLNLERNEGTHLPVVELYQRIEDYLLQKIGESVARVGDSPQWRELLLLEIQRLRREAQLAAGVVGQALPSLSDDVVQQALSIGATDAYGEVKALTGAGVSLTNVVNTGAVLALSSELQTDLAKLRAGVLRSTDDAFRRITRDVTARTVAGAESVGVAFRDAARDMAREGLTGFVDGRGRRWKLDTYAEMATRSATNRAHMVGHTQAMVEHGLDLIVVSSHRNPAPQCAPFEGKVLSLTGRHSGRSRVDSLVDDTTAIVDVKCTLDEALAKGFRHPNAILGGDQLIDMLGGAVAGSKSSYVGPAVTIRTAKGNMATVSPEHPVLTGRGWVTAESLRLGDDVFNAVSSHRAVAGSPIESNNYNMKTTVQDAFSSLEAVGTSSFVPTAGHNFNDDRRFLQKEVHVVETEHSLLPVLDTEIVKETGEVRFVGPNMDLFSVVRDGSFEAGETIFRPTVGRALSNSDASAIEFALHSGSGNANKRGYIHAGHARGVKLFDMLDVERFTGSELESGLNESVSTGRVGDSQDPPAVLQGLSASVEIDKVISVDFVHFSGHAFDFQTVEGVYALGSILVHNCKHTWSAYVPGTRLPQPEPDPGHEGYKATQKQRYYERKIREWKRVEQVAYEKAEAQAARERVRAYQAKAAENAQAHGLRRKYERESPRKL